MKKHETIDSWYQEYKRTCRFHEWGFADVEHYRKYFDDGYTPDEAFEDEVSCADDMREEGGLCG